MSSCINNSSAIGSASQGKSAHELAVEKFAGEPVNRAWSLLRSTMNQHPELASVLDDDDPASMTPEQIESFAQQAPTPFIAGYLGAFAELRRLEQGHTVADLGLTEWARACGLSRGDINSLLAMSRDQIEGSMLGLESEPAKHGFAYGLLTNTLHGCEETRSARSPQSTRA